MKLKIIKTQQFCVGVCEKDTEKKGEISLPLIVVIVIDTLYHFYRV